MPERIDPRRRLTDIAGIDAVERLKRAIAAEARRHPGEPVPTYRQIAMVLHALADHTSIQHAATFDLDRDSRWPVATSVGRWYHAYGDRFEDTAQNPPDIRPLIERSSLGTPDAKAARARVSDEQVAKVMRRVNETEDGDRG